MKWTTEIPTKPGWYWFQPDPVNTDPRIVHVIEETGSLLIDDPAYSLYEFVDQFPTARWSAEPMPEPT
jgi:hypothetical protein